MSEDNEDEFEVRDSEDLPTNTEEINGAAPAPTTATPTKKPASRPPSASSEDSGVVPFTACNTIPDSHV